MSIDSKKNFRLAASYTIGSYILPGEPISTIQQLVNSKIKLTVAPCDEIVKAIKENKLDLGFIESPVFDDSLIYKEWMDDELVLCSKKKLSLSIGKEDFKKFRLVCRKEGSLSREYLQKFFEKQGLSYDDFHSISEVDNPSAIIQSIKWSRPSAPITSVAVVSKIAIEYELKYNDLYGTSINNQPIIRKFYILYKEGSEYIETIENICKELME